MTFISYAQNFEDVMLWRALRHVENGFYIDLGAGHPDDFSVTRAFYDRGWRGINVEPTSRIMRLAGARPRDVNIHAAVGHRADKLTLFVVEDNKDISTLDPMIAEEHRIAGWTIGESQVPVVTLADICREHVRTDVNFLKIDVEGAERDVLLGADLERFRPWIVIVEATAPNRSDSHPSRLGRTAYGRELSLRLVRRPEPLLHRRRAVGSDCPPPLPCHPIFSMTSSARRTRSI